MHVFIRSMQSDKSHGKDGLTKEFYETFWDKLKEIFVNSVKEAKETGHLSTSQRLKNNIKSFFRETKRISTRFNFFITSDLC